MAAKGSPRSGCQSLPVDDYFQSLGDLHELAFTGLWYGMERGL
jgi:hypothetical protein